MTGMSNSLTGFSSALSAVTGMIYIVFLHEQTELIQHHFVSSSCKYKKNDINEE
ncbi:hypothetical protein HanIR_Chr07g0335311 [Helianthus annuus]|nr:hypothetical protein HanIR_Chr07g0335311 [Helianthus annuus]